MRTIEDERAVMPRRSRKLTRNSVAAAAVAAVVAAWGVPLVADAQEQPAPLPAEDVRVVNQVNEPVPVMAHSKPFQIRYIGAPLLGQAQSCHAVEPPEGMYIVFSRLFARPKQGSQISVHFSKSGGPGEGSNLASWGPAQVIDRELLLYALPGNVENEVKTICVNTGAAGDSPGGYATITGRYEAMRPE